MEVAFKKLIKDLKEKKARIIRDGNRVSIVGWENRSGWCDECAIRELRLKGDFEIRRMLSEVIKEGETVTFGHSH
jgi:hypothetical protein